MLSDHEIVRARDASKVYRIYRHPKDRLKQALYGARRKYYDEFWAVRGVSFSVARGETLGIIGRNGSGKSTLLQMVSGILQPTEGEIGVRGRVSALLELGSGFNVELSGRDNIMVSGAVLGLGEAEIRSKLDEIIDFAGIGRFIDLPVKTYSSGMFVRLAFAVAVHVDPEVLIVDEALSVGDIQFQQKCFRRINELRERGLGMIFVSHDLETVKRLCTRVIVMHDGHAVFQGDPKGAAGFYIDLLSADFDLAKLSKVRDSTSAESATAQLSVDASGGAEPEVHIGAPPQAGEDPLRRQGDGTARVLALRCSSKASRIPGLAYLEEPVVLEIEVEFFEAYHHFVVGFMIKDRFGVELLALNTEQERVSTPAATRGDRFVVTFEFLMVLNPGEYSITGTIAHDQHGAKWMDWVDNVAPLRVIDRKNSKLHFGLASPPERAATIERLAPEARSSQLAAVAVDR